MAIVELIDHGQIDAAKKEYGIHWSHISLNLPSDINPHHQKFIKDYFRAQLRLSESKKVKAGRILAGLDERPGFAKFEDNNEQLLAAIDIAVTGNTNRKKDKFGHPIEPSFENYTR